MTEEIDALFEAARWAPSSNNSQPWRYIYATPGSPEWTPFFDLLKPSNQVWATRAGMLVAALSLTQTTDTGKPLPTHSFDTGAAWQNFALQGSAMGLIVHAMYGFDVDAAPAVLGVPETMKVEAMFAVGRPGNALDLPEKLQLKEVPSGRLSLDELVFRGKYPKS